MTGTNYSTRWQGIAVRHTTDRTARLEISYLRKAGALEPGAVHTIRWTEEVHKAFVDRSSQAGEATTRLLRLRRDQQKGPHQEDQDVLVVLACLLDGQGHLRRSLETIRLLRTPCHFGNSRVWFACPGCGKRRGVLFGEQGRFRCRSCHDLVYASTREDSATRAARQCRSLHLQLGGDGRGWRANFVPPAQPDGMPRSTYRKLVTQLQLHQRRYERLSLGNLHHVIEGIRARCAIPSMSGLEEEAAFLENVITQLEE